MTSRRRGPRAGVVLVTAVWLAMAGSAPAEPPRVEDAHDGFLAEALARAAARVDVARRVAPEPVSLTWQRRHLGDVALSGPLLDLAAADLTGDGKAEILALAPGEAVALARREAGALEVAGRVAFDALELAAIRPRDPVGVTSIRAGSGGLRWLARSSERAAAAVIGWRDDRLVLEGQKSGFPICEGVALKLEAGRNTFEPQTEGGEPLHAMRCRRDLVDPEGRPYALTVAVDADGGLHVETEPRCAPGAPCPEPAAAGAADRGYAIAVADLDRDGAPEVAAAARRAPGAPDEVAVWSLERGELVEVYRVEFRGPVAGIAAADINGDGRDELIVAVRAPGRHRVELYTLL